MRVQLQNMRWKEVALMCEDLVNRLGTFMLDPLYCSIGGDYIAYVVGNIGHIAQDIVNGNKGDYKIKEPSEVSRRCIHRLDELLECGGFYFK